LDAAACAPLPFPAPTFDPATTFDQEVASLCAHVSGPWAIGAGTKECGGLLAVYAQAGLDTASLYLFNPTTRKLVETMWAVNSEWSCTGSTTGVDLTSGDASCLASADWALPTTVGWAFQKACSATLPDGAGNVPTLDASSSDASGCPPLQGPATTFDQEVANLCANPPGSPDWAVAPGTKECGGLLAIGENWGVDTQALYLFDPSTRTLVETMSGFVGYLTCTGSATGVDLTKGPAFTAADAAQCLPLPPLGVAGGGWDFQQSCSFGCGSACGEGGMPEASSDAPSE
jgi:hypothetical protein